MVQAFVAPRFISHRVTIQLSGLVFALVIATIAGCGAPQKLTWNDWEAARLRGEQSQQTGVAPLPVAPTLPAAAPPIDDFTLAPHYQVGDGARTGEGFDLLVRHPDFPRTHVQSVHIDLTGPDRRVQLVWAGPRAAEGPIGPWLITPGKGKDGFDCDDHKQSNTVDSFCTPKGVFRVVGFADHLTLTPQCTYATWIIHAPRYIALHAHNDLPRKPASSGCVRMPLEAAKLIHNNSIVGITLVSISGKWERE